MTRAPKRPRDVNQLAKSIVDLATGDEPADDSAKVIRARKAGKVGGPARARSLSPEDRADIARAAATARWKRSD